MKWLVGLLVVLTSLLGCRPQPDTLGGPVSAADILYVDEFTPGETGKWQLEGDEQGQVTFQNEQLVIEVNQPNTVQFVTLGEHSFSNFALEVDATLAAGGTESTYGVLFRMTGPDQFYRFDVTGSGLFTIERYDASSGWTRLSEDWVESEHIATGVGATNRLGVLAIGGTISFYANGNLLLQVADGRYSGGNIGLDAGTYGQTGLRVAFDNLVVSQP
jgi:hypothetical protein